MPKSVFRLLHLSLLLLIPAKDSAPSAQSYPASNQKPSVQIIIPSDKSTFKVGTSFRYRITVSDPEDGQSEYQEISGNQVFLDVLYLRSPVPESKLVNRITWLQNPALVNIKKHQCLNCHRLHSASMGPSFSEIRHRYRGDISAADKLSQRIKEGSRGIWGEAMMPALADVSLPQTKEMVLWILGQDTGQDNEIMLGLEGSSVINPPEHQKHGNILLTAGYIDNGSDGENHPFLEGFDQVLIQYKE